MDLSVLVGVCAGTVIIVLAVCWRPLRGADYPYPVLARPVERVVRFTRFERWLLGLGQS